MNIVLLQTDIVWANPAANVERAESLMDEAPGADLYVLPEMWATGFATQPEGIAEEEERALSLQWMKRVAREKDCAVCGSLAMKTGDGTFRNRNYFVTPDSVSYYDKHHLFSHGHEDRSFKAGDQHVVVIALHKMASFSADLLLSQTHVRRVLLPQIAQPLHAISTLKTLNVSPVRDKPATYSLKK